MNTNAMLRVCSVSCRRRLARSNVGQPCPYLQGTKQGFIQSVTYGRTAWMETKVQISWNQQIEELLMVPRQQAEQ